MQIRFYHDPDSNQPHIYNHNVTEDEVSDILNNPQEDQPGRDDSRKAFGQTKDGRYLKVVYVPDSDADSVFVVTAYDLAGKPLKAFKKRRNKGKGK